MPWIMRLFCIITVFCTAFSWAVVPVLTGFAIVFVPLLIFGGISIIGELFNRK